MAEENSSGGATLGQMLSAGKVTVGASGNSQPKKEATVTDVKIPVNVKKSLAADAKKEEVAVPAEKEKIEEKPVVPEVPKKAEPIEGNILLEKAESKPQKIEKPVVEDKKNVLLLDDPKDLEKDREVKELERERKIEKVEDILTEQCVSFYKDLKEGSNWDYFDGVDKRAELRIATRVAIRQSIAESEITKELSLSDEEKEHLFKRILKKVLKNIKNK